MVSVNTTYAGSVKQTLWEVEKNLISVGINSETPVMLVYTFKKILLHWKESQNYE